MLIALHSQLKKAIEEANKKLQTASDEVAKAQDVITSLEQEKTLMAEATILPPPSPRLVRTWNDVVALDLGISLKQPSISSVETNTPQVLTLTVANPRNASATQWFSALPYSTAQEQTLLGTLATSTPVSYVVNGHLLRGVEGTSLGQTSPSWVLQAWENGQPVYLIWITNPYPTSDPSSVTNVLASLRFAT